MNYVRELRVPIHVRIGSCVDLNHAIDEYEMNELFTQIVFGGGIESTFVFFLPGSKYECP